MQSGHHNVNKSSKCLCEFHVSHKLCIFSVDVAFFLLLKTMQVHESCNFCATLYVIGHIKTCIWHIYVSVYVVSRFGSRELNDRISTQ